MKQVSKATVTVLGSLNVDLVASVERLPRAGETVAAGGLRKLFGGKGANQAVAAARAGAAVRFVGCVGADADGAAYRSRLKGEGIDISGIATVPNALTGTALIGVDAAAENLIMVAPEANGRVTRSHVRSHRRMIETSGVLLMQLEVPFPSVIEAARIANRSGVPVWLNPSPYSSEFPWGEAEIDGVMVNEAEAEQLLGMKAASLKRSRSKWSRAMALRGIGSVVMTRGKKSTLYLSADGMACEVDTLRVSPVDTVGAGDAFAGTLASFLAQGESIGRALVAANCAGGLATLKRGAQEAIPKRRRLLSAMRNL